eukprot:TRINITY_DN713_c0_g1_i1.p1 TRINITY_DN713_c0_g1~~TRINITY_DN713_c0_g1_i1.p1  ORF type:complete len:164 (-),score=53.76 TRINITY_DN713_c0_g1_i1:61-552(-)
MNFIQYFKPDANYNLKQQLIHEQSLDVEHQLQIARQKYTEAMQQGPIPTAVAFNLAYCLISSSNNVDRHQGISLLEELRKGDPSSVEYLYYLSLGSFKVEDYVAARKYADELLAIKPGNPQAMSLRSLSEEKVAKDGMLGMMIVGGAAAAVVSGVVLLMKARK